MSPEQRAWLMEEWRKDLEAVVWPTTPKKRVVKPTLGPWQPRVLVPRAHYNFAIRVWRHLRFRQWTLREIGEVWEISHKRVHQLLAGI